MGRHLFLVALFAIFHANATGVAQTLHKTKCGGFNHYPPEGFVPPQGYKLTEGIGWHKYHTSPTTWNTARKICIYEGGNLAVIETWEEADLLSGIMNETLKLGILNDTHKGGNEALIGMHDFFREGEFVSVHGLPLNRLLFQRWTWKNGGTPNHTKSGDPFHCIALESGIALDHVSCSVDLPFFCEILG